ncbi:MAG: glutaminyl-peptide cyclotransferase [bacterium]
MSRIDVQPQKNNYVFGENVKVQVKTRLKNGEIENIRLYYKNKMVKESEQLDFTAQNVTLNLPGIHSFRAVSTKTDSVTNTRTKTITVLSDIEPQRYTFKTINTFPHNTKHFTQGLEYHNDYLYEGTGENGKSGIFKINLDNGNILNSYLLDEKYFGEGITILNNKIYQLTYHAQKGFVYNLSDFALIDSFSYEMKQGWGLTNDGESLIMGDGTHRLYWLNPDDFSVQKTIQVANNKGLVNNLNELEYIDGTIYANVYTTDIIVQIEPETGRVLSEIYLEGILNMYHNPEDKIDYLNGIAWDAESERLLVTGKWWPRIFEIELVPSE